MSVARLAETYSAVQEAAASIMRLESAAERLSTSPVLRQGRPRGALDAALLPEIYAGLRADMVWISDSACIGRMLHGLLIIDDIAQLAGAGSVASVAADVQVTHVAPAVRIRTRMGIRTRVIDPMLSDEPLMPKSWQRLWRAQAGGPAIWPGSLQLRNPDELRAQIDHGLRSPMISAALRRDPTLVGPDLVETARSEVAAWYRLRNPAGRMPDIAAETIAAAAQARAGARLLGLAE